MKKFLITMVALIITACGILPIYADSGEFVVANTKSLYDSLVIHYDFEGENLNTQFSDKATGGKSKDPITTTEGTFTSGSATATNGIAQVTGSGGMNLYLSNSSETAKGADYRLNDTGAFTFYLSFRIDGDNKTSGGFCDILKTSDSNVRIYTSTCNTTKKTVDLYLRNQNSVNNDLKNGIKVATIPYSYGDSQNDTFIKLAWTMQFDRNSWTHKCYLSADGTNNYEQVLTDLSAADSETFFSAATWLSLGNKVAARSENKIYFEDFRVYNKALSLTEISFGIPSSNGTNSGAVFHGTQNTAVNAGAYSVRFVGSIDSLEYSQVGFCVKVQAGKYSEQLAATCVYKSLLGNVGTEMQTYTAEEIRGEDGYLYALTFTGIPAKDAEEADYTVTFLVTPFYIPIGGNDPIYGSTYQIIYTGGVHQSSSLYVAN